MVVPELDLVIMLYSANYSSGPAMTASRNIIPTLLIPAVLERGDDLDAPVMEKPYKSPYGASKDGSRVAPKR